MANTISAAERTAQRIQFWTRLHTNLAVFLEWNCPHIGIWGTEAEIINGEAILILHALTHAWLRELSAEHLVICGMGSDVLDWDKHPLNLRPDEGV